MDNTNELLIEYQAKINKLTQEYLDVYLAEVPKAERKLETAGVFLQKYDPAFRKAAALIGVEMLHKHDLSQDIQQVVLENNSWAVAKLFVEVMNASSDQPLFASKF